MEEEKRMVRTRRIGSITVGSALVALGILFLMHLVWPAFEYLSILRFWPLIFISLGIEVLLGSRKTEEIFVYDWAAILLMLLLVVFAMGMAGADWIFSHIDWNTYYGF